MQAGNVLYVRRFVVFVMLSCVFFICVHLGYGMAHSDQLGLQQCHRIVILKQACSGSSWFTEELNGIRGVNITAQLYWPIGAQNKHVPKTAGEALAAMKRRLFQSCDAAVGVTGFTQNPDHKVLKQLHGFNFTSLKHQLGGRIHYATWLRSNFVLSAFSSISKGNNMRNARCKTHNLRNASQAAFCSRRKYHVSRHNLLSSLRQYACAYANTVALGRSLGAHMIQYEAFVHDQRGTLRQFLDFLELPTSYSTSVLLAREFSTYVKRSSGNVTSMLKNAADVGQWLQEWGLADLPLRRMFLDTNYTSFTMLDAGLACNHLKALSSRP